MCQKLEKETLKRLRISEQASPEDVGFSRKLIDELRQVEREPYLKHILKEFDALKELLKEIIADYRKRHGWDIETNPEPPLYKSWSEFSLKLDDTEALYTERRVLLKRVTNELRDLEVPLSNWQKVAKALAAVASLFLVLFLALSRAFRIAE